MRTVIAFRSKVSRSLTALITATTTSPLSLYVRESHSTTSRSLFFTTVSFLRRQTKFAPSKCFISSAAPISKLNEAVPCSEVGGEGDVEKKGYQESSTIPVRAFFISTSVDLRSLVEQNKQNFIPPSSRMTNYVVLRFGDLRSDPNELCFSLGGSECSYLAVFQYGSIVLFNVRDHEIDGYLAMVTRHASGFLPEMRKDEYEVREDPSLDTWMQGGPNYILILQYLNTDGIRIVATVLGQSIALDHYARQIDEMVVEFTHIKQEIEKTGKFILERKKLFELLGKANSNFVDVIMKLGLVERSDNAWKDAKYAQIWAYLSRDFNLTERFQSLNYKLKFVEIYISFLRGRLDNSKSDILTCLLIMLMSAETLLSMHNLFM